MVVVVRERAIDTHRHADSLRDIVRVVQMAFAAAKEPALFKVLISWIALAQSRGVSNVAATFCFCHTSSEHTLA